jgi:hypothetical protein
LAIEHHVRMFERASAERQVAEAQLPAVVAHGLLASMNLVVGACSTLETDWGRLGGEQRGEVIGRARHHAEFVSGVLADFLRALPASVNDILDDIQHAQRSGAQRPLAAPRLAPDP